MQSFNLYVLHNSQAHYKPILRISVKRRKLRLPLLMLCSAIACQLTSMGRMISLIWSQGWA